MPDGLCVLLSRYILYILRCDLSHHYANLAAWLLWKLSPVTLSQQVFSPHAVFLNAGVLYVAAWMKRSCGWSGPRPSCTEEMHCTALRPGAPSKWCSTVF